MTELTMTDWQKTLSTDNILVDLSYLGLLSVTGDDAINFLQGQVTNDVKAISSTNSHYSGYCNAKGRLLALFFAFNHQDKLYLSLDNALAASVQKRLQMYVLRSKVTLTDEQANITRFAVVGDQTEALLLKHYPSLPQTNYAATQHDDVTIIRMPCVKPAYQIITNRDNQEKLLKDLSTDFKPVEKAAWDCLETQSGIPEIVTATQEAFVPQMVNLDALGGINFKKGCYTGQEIVARTHYLGKVKRRALLGTIKLEDANITPTAGDTITDATQQNIGQVIRAVASVEGQIELLFECRLDSIANGMRWQNIKIQQKNLPYTT